jgi:hypothetical protein
LCDLRGYFARRSGRTYAALPLFDDLSVAPPPNERSLPDVPVFDSELLSVEIRFKCGGCQQKLQVDAQCEGMTVACPTCQALTWVPKWQNHGRSAEEATPAHESFAQLTTQEIEFLSGVG